MSLKPEDLAQSVYDFRLLRGALNDPDGPKQRRALAVAISQTGANLAQARAILAAWFAESAHNYVPTPAELGEWARDHLRGLDAEGRPTRRAPDENCHFCGGSGWEYVGGRTAVHRCACTQVPK